MISSTITIMITDETPAIMVEARVMGGLGPPFVPVGVVVVVFGVVTMWSGGGSVGG